LAGERLFVVDDDPFMVELLSESLTEAGYQVTTAQTGEEAIRTLNKIEFQVALIDLSLPDADGMDLVRQIADTAPEAQILIMTGFPSLESAIESMQQGAQDYIIKPFKVPEMLAAVDRALRNQKLEAEVRELRRRVRELEQERQASRGSGARPEARPQPARPAGLPGAYGAMAPPRPAPDATPPEEGPAEGESG
jgi:DNA-binding NtrC family response regulator